MKKRYILEETGQLFREETTLTEVAPDNSFMAALSENKPIIAHNIINHPDAGMGSLCCAGNRFVWTFSPTTLTIRAPFQADDKKVLVPLFNSKDAPVMTLDWTPPADCRLKLVLNVVYNISGGTFNGELYINTVWLFALDKQNRCYRLPLANLYDDCSVCTGVSVNFAKETVVDAISREIETWKNSHYNADLWKGSAATFAMFRFKPKDDGFEVLKPQATRWQDLCSTVAPDILKFIVL